MHFTIPESYLAERMRITQIAAEWRRLTPRERSDRIQTTAVRVACDKARGSQGVAPRSSRSDEQGAALGFISNATSRSPNESVAKSRPAREKFKIDRDAARCKRMRIGLSNSARLLHRRAHTIRSAQRWNLKFITLTYRGVNDWRAGHVAAFVNALKLWCLRKGFKLFQVWVAELQARGAIHYHMVVWLPKGKFLPKFDQCGWWPHGSTNIQTAQNPIGYLMKYASKATPEQVNKYPRGARMFGCSGLDKAGREEVRYWRAPIWVRDAFHGTADIRKTVGGYVNAHTGEFLRSPWRVCVGSDGSVWAFKVDQPETMQ